jgi:Fic family protein
MVSSHWIAEEPYDALPLLPPPLVATDNIHVLKACIKASAALGELKQAANLIPNQAMLISLLPILEAKASSEIENIVTTTDKLFQHSRSHSEATDPATKEALRYSKALMFGFQQLKQRPLTTRLAEEICSIIKGADMSVRKAGNTTLVNDATGKVIYTPPLGEHILRDKLKNWEDFLHDNQDIDPIIRMAAAHYQFEAIHPFSDGNGRTGRILNGLFLIEQNLLTLPVLYLSRYFIAHKSHYYERLNNVTEHGDWENWLVFVLKGVEETALWTVKKIAAIRELFEQCVSYIQDKLPKIYSHELVSLIFELPYCRIQDITDKSIAKRQTASVYLKSLCDIGVLEELSAGKEKLFLHRHLLALLQREDNFITPYKDKNRHAPN